MQGIELPGIAEATDFEVELNDDQEHVIAQHLKDAQVRKLQGR